MNFDEKQAIYLQIADYVCDKVLSAEWKPDDKIPSVRELAIDLQVNPNTVMRAYEFLQQREILQNKRGVGHHVALGAPGTIATFRKLHFFENELPRLFKNLQMLDISFEELRAHFENYSKTFNNKQNENK